MKRYLFGFLVIAISITFLNACNNDAEKTASAGFNLDSAKAAIAASNKVFGSCFASGDSAAFINCYTSDACINPPNMPRMCGAQAITAFFNGGRQMGIRNIALNTEEVFGGKDCVVETGTYEMFMENNVSGEEGKFIVVWKEENGNWKMFRDIWNSDPPAPQPHRGGPPPQN